VISAVLSGASKKEDYDPTYNLSTSDAASVAKKACNVLQATGLVQE
jgi:hypothetical protein